MNRYQYRACGLPNVFLVGIPECTDDKGEACVTIENISGLHKVIASEIVFRAHGFTGAELRFLRSEMGLTQKDVANLVRVEPLTVGRWERGDTEIPGSVMTVVRLITVEKLGLEQEVTVTELAHRNDPANEQADVLIDASDPSHYQIAA